MTGEQAQAPKPRPRPKPKDPIASRGLRGAETLAGLCQILAWISAAAGAIYALSGIATGDTGTGFLVMMKGILLGLFGYAAWSAVSWGLRLGLVIFEQLWRMRRQQAELVRWLGGNVR